MSIKTRLADPVRAPIQQLVNHYSTFFEDLIHAVKSELVGKLDHVGSRVDDLDRSVSTSHEAIADQMALHAATLRSLSSEVERLQFATARLEHQQLVALGVNGERMDRPPAVQSATK